MAAVCCVLAAGCAGPRLAPVGETAAKGKRDPLPVWAIEAAGRALAALDKGDATAVRRELATLATEA